MRKACTVVLLLLGTIAFAQVKVDSTSFRLYYQKIFEVEGTKEQLAEKGLTWLTKNFKNTNQGIKMNTDNKIVLDGVFDAVYRDGIGAKKNCKISYKAEVAFKDKKYRLTFENLEVKPNSMDSYTYLSDWGLIAPIDDFETFAKVHADFHNRYMGMGKKMTVKLMENPKKFEKNKARHKKYHDVMRPQIESYFKGLATSLFDYMENTDSDDW